VVEPTLDDVFVAKTGQHLEGAEGAASGPEAEPACGPSRLSRRSAGARCARPSGARSSSRRC
jgi:hypothetical protein